MESTSGEENPCPLVNLLEVKGGCMIIKKKSNIPAIDEGEYEAELVGVEEETANFGNGETYPYLRFRFSILSEKGFGVEVEASVPHNFTPNSKLANLLTGLGVDIERIDELDTDTLIGTKCRVYVEHIVSKKGGVFPQVTKVKPLRTSVQPSMTRPTPQVQSHPQVTPKKDEIPF